MTMKQGVVEGLWTFLNDRLEAEFYYNDNHFTVLQFIICMKIHWNISLTFFKLVRMREVNPTMCFSHR